MSYTKTIWNETTAITPARLQNQEDGIEQIKTDIDVTLSEFQTDVDLAIAQAETNVVNGKNVLSTAINTKRVVSNPDMTFQQLADKVSEINLNKRIANGIIGFVVGPTATLTVTGLPFTPTKLFVNGEILVRFDTNNSNVFSFAFVDGVMQPGTVLGTSFITGITASVEYQADGFILTLQIINTSYTFETWQANQQKWFAQE